MLVREVHLSSQQFKEARRTYIDTCGSITPYTLLTIETNMWCFIDLEAIEL